MIRTGPPLRTSANPALPHPGKGWGVGWESRGVICDGLKSDDLSAQRGLILWMSGSDRPDDHPRTGQDGDDSSIGRRRVSTPARSRVSFSGPAA
jgi:hypothetical protein